MPQFLKDGPVKISYAQAVVSWVEERLLTKTEVASSSEPWVGSDAPVVADLIVVHFWIFSWIFLTGSSRPMTSPFVGHERFSHLSSFNSFTQLRPFRRLNLFYGCDLGFVNDVASHGVPNSWQGIEKIEQVSELTLNVNNFCGHKSHSLRNGAYSLQGRPWFSRAALWALFLSWSTAG